MHPTIQSNRNDPLKILFVEDSDNDADMLVYRLRKAGLQFKIKRVESEPAFRKALQEPFDLVISDFSLPQFSGTAALDIMNEVGINTPLIIVSGAIGEESAVAAMKKGAVDYLLKDRLGRLPQAIVQAVENAGLRNRLESKKKNLSKALSHLETLSHQLVNTQEQERKNLARELHDELGQRLTALNITLYRLQGHLSEEKALSVWREAEREVSGMFNQIRMMSVSLRPPALDYFGLEASLSQLIDRQFPGRTVECLLEYAGVPNQLSETIEITAYRLIQESLTNTSRHAEATRVIIEVNGGEAGNELEIVVTDNGKGFDVTHWAKRPSHTLSTGLMGMRERVELLGGFFSIESSLGKGTRIVAILPLKSLNNENN